MNDRKLIIFELVPANPAKGKNYEYSLGNSMKLNENVFYDSSGWIQIAFSAC